MEFYRFLIFIGFLLSVPLAYSNSVEVRVPENWYVLPENRLSIAAVGSTSGSNEPSAELASAVDRIYQVTQDGLDAIQVSPALVPAFANASVLSTEVHPADWVPWHLDAFATDLAVNVQGLLGVLTVRGTPAVSAIWRHTVPTTPVASLGASPDSVVESDSSGVISTSLQDGELWPQVAPAYRVAMATGQVKDAEAFKTNLIRTANQWNELAVAISDHLTTQGSSWWVSGFRCDFVVSASGHVMPAVLDLGGEVRIRLEWKRLHASKDSPTSVARVQHQQSRFVSEVQQQKLLELITVLEQSLEIAAVKSATQLGNFAPYMLRVGLGMTANGDFGVARAAISALGHVLFSRDLNTKVKVSTVPRVLVQDRSILIIDQNGPGAQAAQQHLSSLPGMQIDTVGSQVVSKITQERFSDGLTQALKMVGFFAREPKRVGVPASSWPLYELRGAFDLSLTGSIGLAGVGGLASTMIYLRRAGQ